MSEEDIARYGAEGAAMTLDEAIAYALGGDDAVEVPIRGRGGYGRGGARAARAGAAARRRGGRGLRGHGRRTRATGIAGGTASAGAADAAAGAPARTGTERGHDSPACGGRRPRGRGRGRPFARERGVAWTA